MPLNNSRLEADLRKLQLKVANLTNSDSHVISGGALGQLPTPGAPSASASNQLRNGDLSHSVRTWYETTATDDDENKECAHWYTHSAPALSQQLYENNSKTGGTPNNTLKHGTHSAYSGSRSDWERGTGVGRIFGLTTLDAPLPQNIAGAGKTEYVVMIAARRNRYITLTDNCRMFAGIWDNTSGVRDWLKASAAFSITGGVTRTPASTLERRYRIFARTDRGFTFLSDEFIVLNAPAAGAFIPNDVYVALSWTVIPEVLSYDVYRYTPSSGVYELLSQVSSGANTYNDQNAVLQTVTGYPTASNDRALAYFATRTGELTNLATDGLSPFWDTISLPVRVPPQYNQGATTDKQWVRIGLTVAPNLTLPDGVTNGTTTVTSAVTQFTAAMTGLPITVSDATHTLTTTVASVTNANTIVLTAAPSWSSTGNTIFILGGGVHGILVDLIHASFVDGAIYAPYFEDLNRPLPASATPNGSNQGGTGGGGSGGGIRCVWEKEKILVMSGNQMVRIAAKDIRPGDALFSGNIQPNYVSKIITGTGEICILRTRNGAYLRASASHRLITSVWDTAGTPLSALRKNDSVLTEKNGKLEWSRVSSISYTEKRENVVTFALTPQNLYFAGKYRPAGFWGFIKRLIYFLLAVKITAAVASHNLKPLTD